VRLSHAQHRLLLALQITSRTILVEPVGLSCQVPWWCHHITPHDSNHSDTTAAITMRERRCCRFVGACFLDLGSPPGSIITCVSGPGRRLRSPPFLLFSRWECKEAGSSCSFAKGFRFSRTRVDPRVPATSLATDGESRRSTRGGIRTALRHQEGRLGERRTNP
jgi:hypothetical protein